MAEILYKTDVDKILDVCLEVYNRLGYGFQELYIRMQWKLNLEKERLNIYGNTS